MKQSDYTLDGSKLSFKGEHIGTVNLAGEIDWTEAKHKSHAKAVEDWLKAEADRLAEEEKAKAAAGAGAGGGSGAGAGGSVKLPAGVAAAVAAAGGSGAAPQVIIMTPEQREAKEQESLAEEGRREIAKYQADLRDDLEFYEANKARGVPEVPKKNPQFGDKTPAYVEWLQRWRPEKYAAKYGIQGPGKVPVVKVDEDGNDYVAGHRDVVFAHRKTHLTEKAESRDDVGSDQDWDA